MNTVLKALAAALAVWAMTPSAAATPQPQELFGTVEFRAASLAALPQWQRVLAGIESERPAYDACRRDGDCPSRAVTAWQNMLRNQAGRAPMEQLRAVNRFLNQWQYRSDMANHGQRDYWATPLEFFSRSGDCEDYAIAKYVSLRQLGFAAEDLRMVVVQDTQRDLAHAVLAVYLDDEVYILDNLTSAVLPQHQVRHYVPYYSVNETTRWAHVAPETTVAEVAGERVAPGRSREATATRPGAAGTASRR